MLTNLQSGKPISDPKDGLKDGLKDRLQDGKDTEEALLKQASSLAQKDSTVNMLLLLTKKMQADLTDYLSYTERFMTEMQALHQAGAEQLQQASGERDAAINKIERTEAKISEALQEMLAAETAARTQTNELMSSLSHNAAAELAEHFDEYIGRTVDQHVGELQECIRDAAAERERCIAKTKKERRRARALLFLSSVTALLSLASAALVALMIFKLHTGI